MSASTPNGRTNTSEESSAETMNAPHRDSRNPNVVKNQRTDWPASNRRASVRRSVRLLDRRLGEGGSPDLTAHMPKITNVRQSLALCVMIADHKEPE